MLKLISEKLFLKTTIKRIKNKINLLNSKTNLYLFLNLRLLFSIILFSLIIYITKNVMIALLLIIPIYIIIEYFCFDLKIKKKNEILEKELLFYLNILIISLESIGNFKKALEITTDSINSNISIEFKKALKEINLGKSSDEALSNMINKIDSINIKNILFNLKESIIYGNNTLDILKDQRKYLNKVILINTKYKISKIPARLIIATIFMFIPLLIFFIFAPILVDLF